MELQCRSTATSTGCVAAVALEVGHVLPKMIAGMRFGFLTNLFTELTVHAYKMFTHLKLR